MPSNRPGLRTVRMPARADQDWLVASGLPDEVSGLMTTRAGGVSRAPFDSLNLRPPSLPGTGLDDPVSITQNQRRFAAALAGAVPTYLNQVHGIRVARLLAGQGHGGAALVLGDRHRIVEPS